MEHSGDLLPGLVTLARDQHDVAGGRTAYGLGDRAPAVPDLDQLGPATGGAVEDRPADLGRLLAARVVVGDHHDVGVPANDLAHEGPLAGVAVASSAEDHDQPSSREGAQRGERGCERVGFVCVVHHDLEVLSLVDPLETAGYAGPCGD